MNSKEKRLNQYFLTHFVVQDKAALMVREKGYVYVDLKWDSELSTAKLMTSVGVIVDKSTVLFNGENPNYGQDMCIGMGYQPKVEYYDWECDSIVDTHWNEIICWGEY